MLTWMKSLILFVTVGAAPLLLAGLAGAEEGCIEQLPAAQREKLNERISLKLPGTPILTTLRLLAQQYKINMVVTEDVTGSVALDFDQVPARDVLQTLIDVAQLECVKMGEAVRVSSSKRVKGEQAERDRLSADERKKIEAELDTARRREREDLDTKLKVEEAARRTEEALRKREREDREEARKRAELEARGPVVEDTIRLYYADASEVATTIQGILGLPPTGLTPAPVPLPQLSSLYTPTPPTEIPSEPPPPQTAPVGPVPQPSPDVLAKGLTVQAYKPTNSVFIRYYKHDLERIKKLIKETLDVPVPQVQIAAQMIISTLNALQQIGIQWGGAFTAQPSSNTALVGRGFAAGPPGGGGTPTAGGVAGNPNFQPNVAGAGGSFLPIDPNTGVPTGSSLVNLPTSLLPTIAGATPAGGLLLGIISKNFNVNLAIQALEVQGKARTLAEPKVVTLENKKAVISRGFEVPYTSTPAQGVQQVQFKDALLRLQVTPKVIREGSENRISMQIIFENNEPDFTQLVNGNPSIFKRREETEVVVREGDRVVVGGVTNERRGTTTRKVPWFGSIPILGWLFKSREVASTGEELIVILTPTVFTEARPSPTR